MVNHQLVAESLNPLRTHFTRRLSPQLVDDYTLMSSSSNHYIGWREARVQHS